MVGTASLGLRSDAAVLLRSGNCGVCRVCKGLGCEIEGQGLGFQCGDAVRGDNTVHEDNFEQEVLKSDVLVLVGFWASWCGPCKLVVKSMDEVDHKYAGKLKVDTDPKPTLVQMFQVCGLHTLIMFRDD